jgi:uncharacterized protein YjbI with pentapeptide repeats
VLDLIVRGHTNGQIAETLGISFATAKWHVSELIGKVGVSSREEVADYWRQERAPGRRLSRTLRGLLAGPALKLAGGGAAVGVAATGVVWVAIAANSGGSETTTVMAVTATPPQAPSSAIPTPSAQPSGASNRPAGCPTSAWATEDQSIFEGLLCHALNWPEIASADAGDCDLRGLDLSGSVATFSHLDHIDFRGCTLDGARLPQITMFDSSFAGVSAVGADFAYSGFGTADMTGADLTGADLVRAQLQGTDFTDAILLGADLTNAITRGARWSNTICPDGTNSDANGGTCVGTVSVSDYWPGPGGWTPPVCSTGGGALDVGKFCAADLYEGIAIDTDGRCHAPFWAPPTTDLRHADLRNCKLAGASLEGADFERASLAGADLAGADLSGVKIFLADLSGANLRGAILDGAVISHSNLEGADLTGASTVGALMRGTYKNTTCPDGSNSDTDDGDGLTCANNLLP